MSRWVTTLPDHVKCNVKRCKKCIVYANVPLPLQISGFLSADINRENLKAHDESIVFMQDLSNRFFFTFAADVASIKELLAT